MSKLTLTLTLPLTLTPTLTRPNSALVRGAQTQMHSLPLQLLEL